MDSECPALIFPEKESESVCRILWLSQSKGTLRLPTEERIRKTQSLKRRCGIRIKNRGSGYHWENATVEEFVPRLAKKSFGWNGLEYETAIPDSTAVLHVSLTMHS